MPPADLELAKTSDDPLSFNIYTGALKSFTVSEDGEERRYFRVTASSTVQDSHGDEFTDAAVRTMAATASGSRMSIFLNHSYEIPEDLFGTVTKAETQNRAANGERVTDLDLEIRLNEANPRAIETAKAIDGGAKLGVSIGAMIREYRPRDKNEPYGGWIISNVELKEASIVGIPANPRTWVQYATKAIKRYERELAVKEAKMPPETTLDTTGEYIEGTLEETVDEAVLNDGKDTLELLDQAAEVVKGLNEAIAEQELDTEKVFTSEDIPGAQPTEAVDGQDDGQPTFEGPDEDEVEAEAETASTEPTPSEAPAAATASETPEAMLAKALDNSAEALSMEALKTVLETVKEEITKRDESIVQLTQERDAALEALQKATVIVETIAKLPLGRKARFENQVKDYRSNISGVYGPEVMKFLKGKNTSVS
jgi:HK97 family phage prohead protease